MIHAIFAVDEEGGLGKNNSLPWGHISEDMAHFKKLTNGEIVIMGRKTWDSLPPQFKPLPYRINAVVTSGKVASDKQLIHIIDPKNIKDKILQLQSIYPNRQVFIIGGRQVLLSCADFINRVHLTKIFGTYDADIKINLNEYLQDFELVSQEFGSKRCMFEEYQRKGE